MGHGCSEFQWTQCAAAISFPSGDAGIAGDWFELEQMAAGRFRACQADGCLLQVRSRDGAERRVVSPDATGGHEFQSVAVRFARQVALGGFCILAFTTVRADATDADVAGAG